MKFFLSLAFSLVFCALSYRFKWLSASGSIVASLFGWSLIFYGFPGWIAPVGWFFLTGSILSKIGQKSSKKDAGDHVRNGWQVLANGGVGWTLLLCSIFMPHPIWFAGFAGSFSAVTADTWGTEIGRLFKGKTRSIISGKPVEKGSSGGVSWVGTIGGVIGAGILSLSVFANPFVLAGDSGLKLMFWVVLAGGVGSAIDSVLGATVQVRYQASTTGEILEKRSAGEKEITYLSGWPFMTNDFVNLICALVGAGTAMLCYNFF